jgi:transposase-like protein
LSTAFDDVVELLAEHGFDGMTQAIDILMNEAMKLERSEALGAGPYKRISDRRGYADGFKVKTVKSRLGELNFRVSQARGVEFHPPTLERDERSERVFEAGYRRNVRPRRLDAKDRHGFSLAIRTDASFLSSSYARGIISSVACSLPSSL